LYCGMDAVDVIMAMTLRNFIRLRHHQLFMVPVVFISQILEDNNFFLNLLFVCASIEYLEYLEYRYS